MSYALRTLGEVPAEFKEVLDNTVVSAVSHRAPLVRVEDALTLHAIAEVDPTCIGGLISYAITMLGAVRENISFEKVKNDPLSKSGCGKDVCHFEFEAVSSTIEYEVGDVVHILPGQDAAAVDAFIKRCNLNPESYIRVEPKDNKENEQSCDLRNTLKAPVRLKTFVELAMDVASASPRRYFFEVMSYFATAEHEKERLQYFASPEGRDDLYEYNQKERRTVLEVL
ncbi:hypothetical protein K7X08_019689 [Anisodus acutangulus]|uniref:Sulfite reductase [NADPH] flavoprotein alpha-component-like FAD-binding domain-containing protein n=1 Tax=Anisodus acutangulus TaxID=402998 RepID=A0A9Q1RQU9_9SOLA|nr:hypothetical protein K7X08_019689 [Anisodus acutangulus]